MSQDHRFPAILENKPKLEQESREEVFRKREKSICLTPETL